MAKKPEKKKSVVKGTDKKVKPLSSGDGNDQPPKGGGK